jgi:hypothetical protein
MSEGPEERLAFVIRFLEEALGRSLTAEERAGVEERQPDCERLAADVRDRMNPMARARATLAFMKKLKARQGTFMQDFEALYKRKAELDREMFGRDP